MINLFIDTSLSDVSIACLKDNTLLNSITRNIPNKHSVYTLSYIKEVLDITSSNAIQLFDLKP